MVPTRWPTGGPITLANDTGWGSVGLLDDSLDAVVPLSRLFWGPTLKLDRHVSHGIDFTEAHFMKAKEFDERFDAGESMAAALDATRMRRPGEEHRRVNVDFPVWMIAALDREATRLGVTRQSLIKVWIAEKLDRGKHPAA